MDQDRRQRKRLKLRCHLQLWRGDGVPLEAETDNISSTGFYCITQAPFSPGEDLTCELFIRSYEATPLVLHRKVRVVRVEIKGLEPGFGVACEFTDREATVPVSLGGEDSLAIGNTVGRGTN